MMMKTIFLQYAQYNCWANERMLAAVLTQSDEVQHRQIPSSFDSLYNTIVHVWLSENAWWQRLQVLTEVRRKDIFDGDTTQLCKALTAQDIDYIHWVEKSGPDLLNRQLKYKNWKGEPYEGPVWQILQHVFNHSTYHRGQLVTMLRQLGVTEIPDTDFIIWTRVQK